MIGRLETAISDDGKAVLARESLQFSYKHDHTVGDVAVSAIASPAVAGD